ncbi:TetR-like C-terminal domain-containing protein [Streptomyces sp. NPDC053367]|uniref:TetR-like C-terminal domain-containing protein n=1 Tax=Streptomyces sp. NPDC053367 TaxID=3365700 RepID=UPI0037D44C4A
MPRPEEVTATGTTRSSPDAPSVCAARTWPPRARPAISASTTTASPAASAVPAMSIRSSRPRPTARTARPGRTSARAPFALLCDAVSAAVGEADGERVAVHLWTALHGAVTVHGLTYFPWPPVEEHVDSLVALLLGP